MILFLVINWLHCADNTYNIHDGQDIRFDLVQAVVTKHHTVSHDQRLTFARDWLTASFVGRCDPVRKIFLSKSRDLNVVHSKPGTIFIQHVIWNRSKI